MEARRLTPRTEIPQLGGATVGDFWAWAYSDVLNNTTRGVFAEFLVGKALGAVGGTRGAWDSFDLLYGGSGIEVKSSAYVQSWPQERPSSISWGIEERFSFDEVANAWDEVRARSADCYVFCLYAETDRDVADVLDVGKWLFFVLSTERINRELGPQKRVGLGTVKRMTEPVVYAKLRERVDAVLAGVGSRNATGADDTREERPPGSGGTRTTAEVESPIRQFHDERYRDAHEDYVGWLRLHPRGFLLNLKTAKRAVLHESGCMHIADYSDPTVSLTDKRKVCAPTSAPLKAWAEEHGIAWGYCRTCLGR